MLLDTCELEAVINLPSGVFQPYSGVGTAILVFKKGESTKSVWFYSLTADGYSLSSTRQPTPENDIPDIIQRFSNKSESRNSFVVPVEKIRENADMSLALAQYHTTKALAIEHADPGKILEEVIETEEEILTMARALLKKV